VELNSAFQRAAATKSEIQISKSETNPNEQNSKFKTVTCKSGEFKNWDLGSDTFWCSEATDEPARKDFRPTEKTKLYHYGDFPFVACFGFRG